MATNQIDKGNLRRCRVNIVSGEMTYYQGEEKTRLISGEIGIKTTSQNESSLIRVKRVAI